MSDLTNVIRAWFEVVGMPIDMAANAVKTIGKEHFQPIADKSKKSLEENMDIINTKYPGVLYQAGKDLTDFKDKIKQAADTTVNYSQAIDVSAFPLLTADDIPGVRAIKHLTGFESEGSHPESKNTQRGDTRRRRHRRQRRQHRRRKRTKKRALKKRHRHKKTRARRR